MTPPVPGPRAGLNAAVAAEIRAEMARQRINASELAEISEVPYGTLRRYLSAERHIDVATLAQLAAALGVTATSVITTAQQRVDLSHTEVSAGKDDRSVAAAVARRVAEEAAVDRSDPEPGAEDKPAS